MSGGLVPNPVLAGLPRPTGDPGLLRSRGVVRPGERGAGGDRDRAAPAGVRGGGAGVGGGGGCHGGGGRGGGGRAYTTGARYAAGASAALLRCATDWEAALEGYDRAVRVAEEALDEEQAQRARSLFLTPGAAVSPAEYVSPLREQARALARQAIEEYETASARCAKVLAAEAGRLRLPAPGLGLRGCPGCIWPFRECPSRRQALIPSGCATGGSASPRPSVTR